MIRPEVQILIVGIVQISDTVELRCVLEPEGWRPDLVVNSSDNIVRKPPECFELSNEYIRKLDTELATAVVKHRSSV